jgi:hypothetical protein
LLLAVIPVLFSGCIQMEHDLRIADDGSATYRLDYAITEQAIPRFRAMFKLKDDLAVAAGEAPPGKELEPLLAAFLDPDEVEIRKQLVAFADAGVSVKSIRQDVRAAWRHITLELAVADLATLAGNPFFARHGFELYPNDEGRYVWSRSPHISDIGSIPLPPAGRELEEITPLLAGFKTVVRVTPPGRILSTTAFRTTLQTAAWEFDFNRQPTALHTLLRQHFHIVFNAPKATLPLLRTAAKPQPPR